MSVPIEYEPIKPAIVTLAKKVSGNLNIKNNKDKKKIELNKQVYLDPEFKVLVSSTPKIGEEEYYTLNFRIGLKCPRL